MQTNGFEIYSHPYWHIYVWMPRTGRISKGVRIPCWFLHPCRLTQGSSAGVLCSHPTWLLFSLAEEMLLAVSSGTIFPQHFTTLMIRGDTSAANLSCSPVTVLGKELNQCENWDWVLVYLQTSEWDSKGHRLNSELYSEMRNSSWKHGAARVWRPEEAPGPLPLSRVKMPNS